MLFLKVLFLLLLVVPFFLFLLYIVDKLMDDLPKGSGLKEDMQANTSGYIREKREHKKPSMTKRQRRNARKQNKK